MNGCRLANWYCGQGVGYICENVNVLIVVTGSSGKETQASVPDHGSPSPFLHICLISEFIQLSDSHKGIIDPGFSNIRLCRFSPLKGLVLVVAEVMLGQIFASFV